MPLLEAIKKATTFAAAGDDESLEKLIETCSDLLLQPEEKEALMTILYHLTDMRATILDLESDVERVNHMSLN